MSGFMRGPGAGDAYLFGNALFTLKTTAADSSGQMAVMEMVCPPGLVESGHQHLGRDIRHGFSVVGQAEAKVLIIVGPAHFDGHVAEAGERQKP